MDLQVRPRAMEDSERPSYPLLSLTMSLSRAEVEKIALLGRLLLSEEELQRMTVQLGDILGYMDLLGEVDTTNVEPMAHARDMANVFRDDVARPEPRSRAGPGQRPAPGRGVLPRARRAVGPFCRKGPDSQ